jgi:hypothetical protein
MSKTISRDAIPKNTFTCWSEMSANEAHHDHPIIEEGGRYYWKPIGGVRNLTRAMDLNSVWTMFDALGWGRNSEQLRHLYRCMGYSLFGYWEVFYWEANNPDADQYKPPTK